MNHRINKYTSLIKKLNLEKILSQYILQRVGVSDECFEFFQRNYFDLAFDSSAIDSFSVPFPHSTILLMKS